VNLQVKLFAATALLDNTKTRVVQTIASTARLAIRWGMKRRIVWEVWQGRADHAPGANTMMY
jgi:hypothetical protein